MTGVVTGTTRELACLALGHEDAGEVRCLTSDDQLVRELVDEVQRLRVAAGLVEESDLDREERIEVLAEVLTEVAIAEVSDEEYPTVLLAALDESGWTLHPVRRQ